MKKLLLVLTTFCMFASASYAQGILSSLLGSASKPNGPKIKFVEGDENANEEILLIKLQGIIQEISEDDSMMGSLKQKTSMIDKLKDDLILAAKRKAIVAVLVDINSPGGEVTASDLIYHMFKKFTKETGKPVFAHIGSNGASGAYYAACGCVKIYSLPTSMIGSIGVLLQSVNIEELANKLGIKAVTIKSDKTPMKDILSPFRQATEEEKAMLLELVEDSYNRFVDIVAENRKLDREAVVKLANGAVYSATKANKLGLTDGIGYREDVVENICKACSIKSAAVVQRSSNKGGIAELLSSLSESTNDIRPLLRTFANQLMIGNTPVLMFK